MALIGSLATTEPGTDGLAERQYQLLRDTPVNAEQLVLELETALGLRLHKDVPTDPEPDGYLVTTSLIGSGFGVVMVRVRPEIVLDGAQRAALSAAVAAHTPQPD